MGHEAGAPDRIPGRLARLLALLRPTGRRRALAVAAAGATLAVAVAVGADPATDPPPRPAAQAEPTTTSTAAATSTTAAEAASPPADPGPAAPPEPAAPEPAPPAPAPAPHPSTPLAAGLEAALGGTPGCLVVEQDGAVVFERNPATPFVPASAQKIMVGAAALARLGPDHRFETRVVAPRAPGPDGVLHGAWLVGGGDPYLATPEYAAYTASKPRLSTLPLTPLTQLADALVAAGVREVPGGFQPDESRYDTARSVPTWKPSYVREAEVGSLGALTVNEGLATWGGASQTVAPDPAAATTGALTGLLAERGVPAGAPGAAPAGRASAPPGSVVVASVLSAPLADVVAAMVRASDNYAAEMLLRELDRATGGTGSTAGGAARVVAEMAAAGVATDGVHLNDGSGLDTGNRSTCRALLGALTLTSRPGLGAVLDGLAVAGRSGTLVNRFVGTPVEGRLAAKTGWLSGASALVGRVDGQPTRRFALVLNGDFNFATSAGIQNRVVDVLASVP